MIPYLIYLAEQMRYERLPGPIIHCDAEPCAHPVPYVTKPRRYRRSWGATRTAWRARLKVGVVRPVED
ncbi:MAG TPA: hypothetical protein VN786_04405 [Acidimicrobiales bacterium]|nr:hypothetical protein [Acidimicrobiales bacterium]